MHIHNQALSIFREMDLAVLKAICGGVINLTTKMGLALEENIA
jgi:hypothetical protein